MNKKTLIGIVVFLLLCMVGAGVYFVFFQKKSDSTEDANIKRIKDAGKIVIATEATYPPMESVKDDGTFEGFDIDLGNEIAKDLGVKAEFVNTPWDDIFTSLQDGKVDVIISSVTIKADRLETMAFSDPYFNAGQTMIVKKTNTSVTKPEDMQGLKIGLQRGTTSEVEVLKYASDSNIVDYNDYATTPADLLAGKINVIVIDYPAGLGMIKSNSNLKMVGDPFSQEYYGVAMRKNETGLQKRINDIIRTLKQNGTLDSFEAKWF